VLTYEDLRICASLAREAEDLLECIKRTRSMLERMAPVYTAAPGSGDAQADRVGEGVAKLADLETAAQEKLEAYLDFVAQVGAAIDTLAEPDQRRVLRLRYLEGLRWEAIAEKTHFHERWCKELHHRALIHLFGASQTQHTKAR
jgi:DNA-directed RNA polymerase specialized sigma24 family protein